MLSLLAHLKEFVNIDFVTVDIDEAEDAALG